MPHDPDLLHPNSACLMPGAKNNGTGPRTRSWSFLTTGLVSNCLTYKLCGSVAACIVNTCSQKLLQGLSLPSRLVVETSMVIMMLYCCPFNLLRVDHFSGISGRRSTTYLPRATLTIGTPGTTQLLAKTSRPLERLEHTLPNSSLQILVIRRHNVHPLLHTSIHNTVIGIDTLVVAGQPLESLISCDL
jgi:hypothetical protein